MPRFKPFSWAFLILPSVLRILACSDHDDHDHSKRTLPSVRLTPPTRELDWGDINIIHTTDTHGWLLGHQKSSFPEPNYSGDLGDFASFVTHMKEIALERDVDLLLVDSGDLHDGTGLSDGFPPGGVDGHESNQFIAKLPYDAMAIGNHELGVYANTLDMHSNFAPQLKGRYLSSNVNITISDSMGNPISVPVGSEYSPRKFSGKSKNFEGRFAKFKTRKGRQVTSFGVLFSFTGNVGDTAVQPVADMVQENWFLEAIRHEPDFFLLVGHMPVQRDDWPLVFNAVRAVHKHTPILILGGHSHIRDCVQLDDRSMALESGRYMETVGWMSLKLGKQSGDSLKFTRRYLDPNRVTYEFHTRRASTQLDTPIGKLITQGLLNLSQEFDLNFTFGTAPRDFTQHRSPFPSEGSLLSLFINQAVPAALAVNNTRASKPALFITNSESQRFDILAGPFTKNDQLTASPFTDAFAFIADVPLSVAAQVLPTLNHEADQRRSLAVELARREQDVYAKGFIDTRFRQWLQEMDRKHGEERRSTGNLTLGYVTTDSCPGIGDDVLHAPLPFFPAPDFIASNTPNVTADTPIDLIFVDFIQSEVLQALNSVRTDTMFSDGDVKSYSPLLANQVLGVFAQIAWK